MKKLNGKTVVNVRSIDEFLERIHDRGLKRAWYRGVTDSKWDLQPSIFWKNFNKSQERLLCRRFRSRSAHLLLRSAQDSVNNLVLMQHFGLPTRLLDWTQSLPVALSFAFNKLSGAKPAVWMLDPCRLNETNPFYRAPTIPASHSRNLASYGLLAFSEINASKSDIELPICFKPYYPDNRILVQQSRFTIHGTSDKPLQKQISELKTNSSSILVKYIFKLDQAEKRQAALLKINDEVLYPDRDGLMRRLLQEIDTDPRFRSRDKRVGP